MTPEQRLQILESIVRDLVKSDRYTVQKTIQIQDGRNIQTGRLVGSSFGSAADQKLSLYGATPVIQPALTGLSTGFTQNAGFTWNPLSTAVGNIGSTAYNVGDVVRALKSLGILAP